jgi:predicted DNA-binding protein
MLMSISRRLQVLVEERQYDRLERAARRRSVSVATVVREAIDAYLPVDDERKQQALEAILAAEPMPVGSPAELRRELDAIRGRDA